MAQARNEHELNAKAANYDIVAKRLRRVLLVIDKCHKINFWHKVKEKISGKCEICKELEGLK